MFKLWEIPPPPLVTGIEDGPPIQLSKLDQITHSLFPPSPSDEETHALHISVNGAIGLEEVGIESNA